MSPLGDAHEQFQAMFTASPIGIALSDEFGHLVAVNPALCALFGRKEHDLLGASSASYTHPDDLETWRNAQALQDAAPDNILRIDKRYVRPGGRVVWARVTARPVSGPAGQRWTLAHIEDVSERHEAEIALRDSETTLSTIATVMHRIVRGEDAAEVIAQATLSLAGALGAAVLEPHGRDLRIEALAGCDAWPQGGPGHAAALAAWRSGKPVLTTLPRPAGRPSGPAVPAAVLCHPVTMEGGVRAVLGAAWSHPVAGLHDEVARAVTLLAAEAALALQHAALLEELRHRAVTDELTGLTNRRGWSDRLDYLLRSAHRSACPLTVAVIDLDGFKAYNDAHGHLAGDQLLRTFVHRAQGVLRESDVLARWGGDEFALALPDCQDDTVGRALDRIRACMPENQTCSAGFATWDANETADQLITRADTDLYRAKAAKLS